MQVAEVAILNEGNEEEYYSGGSEYSAEVEQVAAQANKDCEISECLNELK